MRDHQRSFAIGLYVALVGLFALPALTQASEFKVIYNFTGGTDGVTPSASPIIGRGGILYGTTFGDYFGPAEYGAVYSLTPPAAPGQNWVETTLFDLTLDTGVYPSGVLAMDSRGVLYGTSSNSGPPGDTGGGALFSLTPPKTVGSPWIEDTLYLFENPLVGYGPLSNVVFGFGGALYGTTLDPETVYAAVPGRSAGAPWSVYPLHTFGGHPGDGLIPGQGLIVGKGGVLYGTTEEGGTGGSNGVGYAAGTVYSVTPPSTSGGGWTEQVLYSFSGHNEGAQPASILTIDRSGVLYGTTAKGPQGAGNGCGTVFLVTPPAVAGGAWQEKTLYFFQGGSDGCASVGGVVFGRDGNLYGTTIAGGETNQGTLYSLTPPTNAGGKWTHTVLHSFSYADGTAPETSLVLAAGGILYGVAPHDGIGFGTVFAFQP